MAGSFRAAARELGRYKLDVVGVQEVGRVSRRWDVGIWTGLDWPRIETGGGRL